MFGTSLLLDVVLTVDGTGTSVELAARCAVRGGHSAAQVWTQGNPAAESVGEEFVA